MYIYMYLTSEVTFVSENIVCFIQSLSVYSLCVASALTDRMKTCFCQFSFRKKDDEVKIKDER